MSVQTSIKTAGSSLRDRFATGLMLLAVLAVFYAFISAVGVAQSAGAETRQVEWWRALGFLLFTGLFAMLAFWPRRYPGLWELVILDKAALTVVEALLIRGGAAQATETAVVDGILVVVLVAAYLLSRGYASWKR